MLLLHDVCDVLMEAAKLCNYFKWDGAATAIFAAFLASWFACRLVLYPLIVIRSTMFEVVDVLGREPPLHGPLNALLCILYLFHVYWFVDIVRIAWIKMTTGSVHDIREEDD